MKKNVTLLLMSVLTCIALSPIFAESNDISFDDTNCVILSDGGKCKISIPVPSGWKNMYEDPENADLVREADKQQDPLNDTNAHYLNSDGLWNEALVKVNKKLRLQPIRHSMFLEVQKETIKEIEQNTIATTILKKR